MDNERVRLARVELAKRELARRRSATGGSSMSDVAGFVSDQVSDLAPWNKANEAFKSGVGEVAEFAGSQGANPYVTAAALTPVAMAPELMATFAGRQGIYNSTNPTVKGLVNTPQELSPQYTAQNAAIGVTRRIPQEGGRLPTYAKPELQGLASRQPRPMVPAEPLPSVVPERLPGRPADFMSYANQKLGQHGGQVNPQELMDWQVKLQTDMSNPGRIPKFNLEGGGKTTIYQQAADLSSRVKGQFNQVAEARLKAAKLPEGVMPTRAGLDQAYAMASKIQHATRTGLKSTWTVGKYGVGISLAGSAIGEFVRRMIPNGR